MWDHCKTVFEAMGCYYHFCECMEVSPLLKKEEIKRGQNRRELDRLGKDTLNRKVIMLLNSGNVSGRNNLSKTLLSKIIYEKTFHINVH